MNESTDFLSPKEKELQQQQINGNELVCRSWLLKRSRTTLSWKKTWFVLRKNGQLTWYKDDKEYKPLDIMNLHEDDVTVSKILKKTSKDKEKAVERLVKEKEKFQFALFSPKNKTLHLKAVNEYDYNNWFLNLEKMLLNAAHPFYEDATNESIANDNNDNNDYETQAEDQRTLPDFENSEGDYFTSDNEAVGGGATFTSSSLPIPEENEEQMLREQQEAVEEESSTNKLNLERIENSESRDFMKDYLIQHYSYNSNASEHMIQKGYLLRLKNLNQWKKFFIILTNKHLVFYKIHNYSDTLHIDYENLLEAIATRPEIMGSTSDGGGEFTVVKRTKDIKIYPTKIIDLKWVVDVVELDPLSKSKRNCLLIITPTKRYRFCTKTEAELVNWLIIFKSFLIVRKKELEFTLEPTIQSRAVDSPS